MAHCRTIPINPEALRRRANDKDAGAARAGLRHLPKRGAKSAGVRMHMSRASFLLAMLVLTATYLFGAYSARHQLFPFPFFQALKTRAGGTAPDLYRFDQAGRLATGDQKKAVACPQQTYGRAVADRAVQTLEITRGSGSARNT